MPWQVEFDAQAEDDLAELDRQLRTRVLEKIQWFAYHLESLSRTRLHGEWGGFAKLRVGDWRVIYTLDFSHRIMKVEYIDRRDKVYKKHHGKQ